MGIIICDDEVAGLCRSGGLYDILINNQSINHFNQQSQVNFNLNRVLVAEFLQDG